MRPCKPCLPVWNLLYPCVLDQDPFIHHVGYPVPSVPGVEPTLHLHAWCIRFGNLYLVKTCCILKYLVWNVLDALPLCTCMVSAQPLGFVPWFGTCYSPCAYCLTCLNWSATSVPLCAYIGPVVHLCICHGTCVHLCLEWDLLYP